MIDLNAGAINLQKEDVVAAENLFTALHGWSEALDLAGDTSESENDSLPYTLPFDLE